MITYVVMQLEGGGITDLLGITDTLELASHYVRLYTGRAFMYAGEEIADYDLLEREFNQTDSVLLSTDPAGLPSVLMIKTELNKPYFNT